MDIRLEVDRLDHAQALDRPVEKVQQAVRRLMPRGRLKDLLHGTWLGHPLHPLLTDLPIGCWTNAMLLDLGGKRTQVAADRLVAAGIVAAVPTVAAGLADWSDLERPETRTGLVHAAANAVALACYTMSYIARRQGCRGMGVGASWLGAAAASVGGYLGGHLSYRLGTGVDRNAFQTEPEGWVPVLDEAGLAERTPVRAQAGELAVLLYRRDGRIMAVGDTCSHLGGPLHEGTVSTEGDEARVTCPWHASTFSLEDGRVLAGPAQSPQPAFDVRVVGGKVELRLQSERD